MKTMKRAVITGVKQAMLLDTPIPEPKEDWVQVKVHAVPLCTEYKGWLKGSEYSGHEAAGEVVKSSPTRESEGRRSGCRHAGRTLRQMRLLYFR